MVVLAMTGDGLKAVAKAAELMVELLGSKAAKEALSHKRKTIKLGDVERAGMLFNQQTLAPCRPVKYLHSAAIQYCHGCTKIHCCTAITAQILPLACYRHANVL